MGGQALGCQGGRCDLVAPASTLDQFDDFSPRANKAYERMMKGEVRYRFVIDIASPN